MNLNFLSKLISEDQKEKLFNAAMEKYAAKLRADKTFYVVKPDEKGGLKFIECKETDVVISLDEYNYLLSNLKM